VKLKSQPEDFVVTELTDFVADGGNFALYRLDKRGLGTPEAAQAILSKWNLKRDAIQHGGLKDRHAVTSQHITIFRGPRENAEDRSWQLTYLGQASRPFRAQDILRNRFDITLRSLSSEATKDIQQRIAWLQQGRIVNYFDDQRFGSLGYSNEFIARPWCLGNYERALYLALAEENSHDRPREKERDSADTMGKLARVQRSTRPLSSTKHRHLPLRPSA
jgi:tRNA pseudouridine13 synthase